MFNTHKQLSVRSPQINAKGNIFRKGNLADSLELGNRAMQAQSRKKQQDTVYDWEKE
jgi:hypothetical protein